MATRQYIGARYVPKFYEGTNGAEWEAGIAYEPLTIVTYLGNSFTSKKPVPVGIGAPNSAPAYWASTGIYSEQVEQYRQEVEAVKEGYLNEKKIAILGDSSMSAWQTYDHLSEFTNASIDNQATSGAKWADIITQLQAITELPDIIIVLCGSNDITASDTNRYGEALGAPDVANHEYKNDGTVFDTIKKFLSLARSSYPKAEIICLERATHPIISRPKWEYYTYFESQIMNEWGVPVIDTLQLLNFAYFNTAQQAWAVLGDHLHYSDEMNERYQQHLCYLLKNAWMYNVSFKKPTIYYSALPTNNNQILGITQPAAWVTIHCQDNQSPGAFEDVILVHYYDSASQVDRTVRCMASTVSNSCRILAFISGALWYTTINRDPETETYTLVDAKVLQGINQYIPSIATTDNPFNISTLDNETIFVTYSNYSKYTNTPPVAASYAITCFKNQTYRTYLAISFTTNHAYMGRSSQDGGEITWTSLI